MEKRLVQSRPQRPFHGAAKDDVRFSNTTPMLIQTRRSVPAFPTVHRRKYGRVGSHRCFNNSVEIAVPSEDWADFGSVEQLHLTEGYVQVSSQLQLFPGSITRMKELASEIPEWEMVAETVFLSSERITCPICLDPPLAPRAERCGHVYCGPCAIQFIRYDNDCSSKKCALCSWIIKLEDLKRVNIRLVEAPKLDSTLNMKLVRRRKSSCSDVHESQGTGTSTSPAVNREMPFLVELSWDDLKLHTISEIEQLEALRLACIDECDTELLPAMSYMADQLSKEVAQYGSNVNQVATKISGSSPQMETLQSDQSVNYFYQAADGQLVFLDGLMWNCLSAEFKSADLLPSHITVKIVAIKNYKMSAAFRKRWRHLDHIPLGHMFSLIEIGLNDLVSESVLKHFSVPLQARSIERDRLRFEDLRLTKLKEAAENRISYLPEGFILSGHALLDDGNKLPFEASDFLPLCSSSVAAKQSSSAASFAEVTKSGALNVVDKNRIATFVRGSPAQATRSFNPNTEFWPSLTASVSGECTTRTPVASTSSSELIVSLETIVTSSTGSRHSGTKRHRRRRSENSGLNESSVLNSVGSK